MMQISAIEVAKLSTKQAAPAKPGAPDLEFKQITPDSLPQTRTVEPDAQEVARVTKLVKDMPDEREDLVMMLKERIEKGEYNVSGEEIAEMMVRRMQADSIK